MQGVFGLSNGSGGSSGGEIVNGKVVKAIATNNETIEPNNFVQYIENLIATGKDSVWPSASTFSGYSDWYKFDANTLIGFKTQYVSSSSYQLIAIVVTKDQWLETVLTSDKYMYTPSVKRKLDDNRLYIEVNIPYSSTNTNGWSGMVLKIDGVTITVGTVFTLESTSVTSNELSTRSIFLFKLDRICRFEDNRYTTTSIDYNVYRIYFQYLVIDDLTITRKFNTYIADGDDDSSLEVLHNVNLPYGRLNDTTIFIPYYQYRNGTTSTSVRNITGVFVTIDENDNVTTKMTTQNWYNGTYAPAGCVNTWKDNQLICFTDKSLAIVNFTGLTDATVETDNLVFEKKIDSDFITATNVTFFDNYSYTALINSKRYLLTVDIDTNEIIGTNYAYDGFSFKGINRELKEFYNIVYNGTDVTLTETDYRYVFGVGYIKSIDKISGLTKEEITPTQQGDVWLLNDEEATT